MVLKHASQTPLVGERISNAFHAAGVPEDIFQNLFLNHKTTTKLIQSRSFDFINFTGSVSGGRSIESAASGTFTGLSLELGGKNPVIVNDSLNLDAALDQITAAGFAVCGQRCTAISRVIVHTDLEAQVIEGLAKRANAIIPSDGTKDDAQMGPGHNNACEEGEGVC